MVLLKTQPNAQIHAVITATVLASGWWLGISRTDWICVILAAGSVWAAEGLNTSIEFLTDRVSPEWSTEAARVKDVAAAAVLLAAIAAAVTGCLVFGPPLLQIITADS
jgi:diacylglycerol kinase (ATP)